MRHTDDRFQRSAVNAHCPFKAVNPGTLDAAGTTTASRWRTASATAQHTIEMANSGLDDLYLRQGLLRQHRQ
jgi:hypothetical protein